MVRSSPDATFTMKLLEEVTVPAGVVTDMVPVVAPVGTVAVIWVALFTVKVADVPLNFTEVAAVKPVPVMVTLAPTNPLVGVKLAIVGVEAEMVKFAEEVAVPAGVVAEIFPVVALEGTVAVIFVLLLTANVADVPLNFTEVVPVRLVPVIATLVPTVPVVGVKLVIAGDGCVTVKALGEVALPPGVVTRIEPVVAAAGTAVVICVVLFMVNVAAVPLNESAEAPAKFVPEITTLVPEVPLVGVKLEIVGAGMLTVKFAAELADPPGVVTEIFPVVAPTGTEVVICVALVTVKVATVPLNDSAVAPVRFVPVIVTLAPTRPLAGVKLAMVGAAAVMVKLADELAVPFGVTSEIFPVVAPAGTVAEI